ncbi:MAG: phage baseplate assembly protein V [Burkholderiales bacterium]|nr:phage baseplate assembly protein V [Burkholderiales bacterium]
MHESAPIAPLELLRRLENLLRPGTIHAVDHRGGLVRVASGDLITNWLPWIERRAGNVRTWAPPSVGEQCLVLSPGGDIASGMVLTGLYSDGHPAPAESPALHRTQYPDGAVIDYDHAAHSLTATLPVGGTANVIAPGGITLDAPTTHITGECLIEGLLTYTAGMHGMAGGSGATAAVIQGEVVATGDVVSGGVSLQSHVHSGVKGGGDTSGGPQ